MRKAVFFLFVLAALTACTENTSSIVRVTALPPVDPAAVTPTFVVALPTSTLIAPTASLLELTAAAGSGMDATPTPLDVQMSQGEARAIAVATDQALQPTPRTIVNFDTDPVAIRFDEFYDGFNLRYGLTLSDKLVNLDGRSAILEGYMAPPLKAELDYFVLTRIQLAFCPFCSTAADWPDDIALVYMPEGEATTSTGRPMRVTGRMEIGRSVDQETGMVSLVRLYADRVEPLG